VTASEYHLKVIAHWRVGCIERRQADDREYVGKHHKPSK
jgi:hypothetical protein